MNDDGLPINGPAIAYLLLLVVILLGCVGFAQYARFQMTNTGAPRVVGPQAMKATGAMGRCVRALGPVWRQMRDRPFPQAGEQAQWRAMKLVQKAEARCGPLTFHETPGDPGWWLVVQPPKEANPKRCVLRARRGGPLTLACPAEAPPVQAEPPGGM